MFFRRETDGTEIPVDLRDLFSSANASTCWIVGGGPGLTAAVADTLRDSPAPKFSINLAGSGLLRPTFWTSYDPTVRFHRSLYLDAGILKFVHSARAMDLVPGTRMKVCECPGLLFFPRDRTRGFHNFLSAQHPAIADWRDSFIQAIDLAWRLGFRRLFLAGCDMLVEPSLAWREAAEERHIIWLRGEPLRDFRLRCERSGIARKDIERWQTGPQYHFDESKPLAAAEQTDFHYFRVAQWLRLCRRNLSRAGLQLVSVTPGSRLNDDFAHWSLADAAQQVLDDVGDPAREVTRGLYTGQHIATHAAHSPMRDFKPLNWTAPAEQPKPSPPAAPPHAPRGWEQLREVAVPVVEEG